jgi:hypothetical protein
MTSPKAMLAYSHEELAHNEWVEKLATSLCEGGVDARFDKWELRGGDDIAAFMESEIQDAEFIVAVCTPLYAEKCNAQQRGVGYEKGIISAAILSARKVHAKVIPILRKGDLETALPTFLQGKLAIDFRTAEDYVVALSELLRSIHEAPHPAKPRLGRNPFSRRVET